MRRQLKNYLVVIGNVDKLGDQPQFGTANIRATDAFAAAKQADLNLGKRQYVSSVEFHGFVPVATPEPVTVADIAVPAAFNPIASELIQ